MLDILQKRTPVWKFAECTTANTTVTVWTPAASTRIALTNMAIANTSGVSNTVLVTFGDLAGTRIGVYALEASTTLLPVFPGISSTEDRTLHAVAKAVPVQITAYGFEL